MPRCLGASGSVRARRWMWSALWALDVQIFWPLMTKSSPSCSARGLEGGEVGAGVGLGESLAPPALAAGDASDVLALLGLGAVDDEGGAELVGLRVDAGAAGVGHFLAEDGLVGEGPVLTAVFLGPRHGDPAAGADLHTQGTHLLGEARVGGLPLGSGKGEFLGHLVVDEAANLVAVGLFFWGEAKVHGVLVGPRRADGGSIANDRCAANRPRVDPSERPGYKMGPPFGEGA